MNFDFFTSIAIPVIGVFGLLVIAALYCGFVNKILVLSACKK